MSRGFRVMFRGFGMHDMVIGRCVQRRGRMLVRLVVVIRFMMGRKSARFSV
jgi:hypothetical protein